MIGAALPDEATARGWREAGWWAGVTILDALAEAVRRTPGKTAVVAPGGVSMTYAELDAEAGRLAAGLAALGVGPGDVVALQLPNCAEFVCLHLAISRLGAVTNPLLPNYRAKELDYILRHGGAKVAVIPARHRGFDYPPMYAALAAGLPGLRAVVVMGGEAPGMVGFADLRAGAAAAPPPARVDSGEITALIFTSGTESTPKGVMHSHDTTMYATRTMARVVGLGADDVVWMPSPIAHGNGFLWGMRQALTIGGTLVLQDAWDPEEALRLIETHRCTFTLCATPFAAMLVEQPSAASRDLACFRIFATAGAPIPRHLGPLARERIGCTLIGMWGMTECFVGTASPPDDPDERLWGTDGRAMPGTEVAIFDEDRQRILPPGEVGELATRGPHVALGYLNDPERTRQTFTPGGWLFTGDLATLDAAGCIRIAGRRKDIINRGGLKVSASEVEELLLLHPAVREVAVVGVPDARLGEKGCAFVVPRGDAAPDLAELVRHLEARGVARYKLPEYMRLVPELPMTPSGKVQKFVLRESFTREHGQAGGSG